MLGRRPAGLHLMGAVPLLVSLAAGTGAMADEPDRGFRVVRDRPAAAESRLALVIGNAKYRVGPLKNPSRDARAVAASLRDVGFDVEEAHDLDRRGMLRAIRRFGDRLKETGGVGLFYFAGHGMQLDGRSYLLPVGADIRVEADIELEAVDAARVLARMDEAGNRLNLVVLDACRNNPVARGFRSREAGLAFLDAPTGTLISYATAPGRTAADGDGSNSAFSLAFAEELRTPGLKVEDVFKRVRQRVREATDGEQTPWESSSLEGDFFFVPGEGAAPPRVSAASTGRKPAPPPAAPPPAEDPGDRAWSDEEGEPLDVVIHEHAGLDDEEVGSDRDDSADLDPTRNPEPVSVADLAGLEAQLGLYRLGASLLGWADWFIWSAPIVGLTLTGVFIYMAILNPATALALLAVAAVCGVATVVLGVVALACYVLYFLFESLADSTEEEIRARDPAWISPYADERSPRLAPPERQLVMAY